MHHRPGGRRAALDRSGPAGAAIPLPRLNLPDDAPQRSQRPRKGLLIDAHTTYRQHDQLIVLDVRQPHEWRTGRIEGARHIPLTQLPRRLRDLDRHTPIVVVCRSGHRSGTAAKLLRALGVDAHNLDGGVNAWTAAGLPFATPDGHPGQVA